MPPLQHAQPTRAALIRAVLDGFERRDRDSLLALGLSEHEFRDHVWPDLPAAKPERNLPFSFVWGDSRQKSDASLTSLLAEHGGRHYDLISERSTGRTTQYRTYVVYRASEITVKDPSGATSRIRLLGSILEKDGRFKVFSYIVD